MDFARSVRDGARIVGRHRWLILVLWLAPLLPAVVLAWMAASNIQPAFGRSLFAGGILHGDWFVVWSEFRSSPADALAPLLGPGTVVMIIVTLVVQVLVAAGLVEVLLERQRRHAFLVGIGANWFRFLRTAVLLVVGSAVSAVAAGVVMGAFFDLAEARSDGRLDIAGVAAGGLVFLLLWAPQKLAADVSRIAAVHHGDRSMTLGFFRALAAVVTRPLLFAPLIVGYLGLILLLHGVYGWVRSPWTPATAAALLGLLLLQQSVMALRAAVKLGFWGAEVGAFGALHRPRWCRPRPGRDRARRPEVEPQGDGAVVEEGAGI